MSASARTPSFWLAIGNFSAVVLALAALLAASSEVTAGPPYLADDPEPVEYRHWEFYLASLFTKGSPSLGGYRPASGSELWAQRSARPILQSRAFCRE
jgi:hypothetical protein